MYSKRIDKIVSKIPQCNLLADIGCDHGYIGVSALRQGIAKKCLFSDISAPSLNKAKLLCQKLGLDDRAEFFVGDGTQKIDYADCVVIAGMGGRETIDILKNCKFAPDYFVLQPMKNLYEVREYVAQHYHIIYDKITFDKKFYNLLVLGKGQDTLTEMQKHFGKTNLEQKHDDFVSFVRCEIAKTKKLLNKKPDNQKMVDKLALLTSVEKELEK
ncbi:MAG: SAM-dependent methyltransferase [Clostridia bacterium]|nr:SAM-dependent methyltransferase [Clostridia bacterium]